MSEEFIRDYNCYLYIGDVLAESGVLQDVESFLCYRGGRVFRVSGKTEARAIVENNNITAVVVDQYLPFCSGLDFMHWLHNFVYIPTIMIVMNDGTADTETVVVLEAGAADAVRPDISARELAARINACARKYHYSNPCEQMPGRHGIDARTPSLGDRQPLYFTPQSRRLYYSDTTRVVLHTKEAEVMALLIQKYPEFIDREEISQTIFHQSWNPNDRRIDNLISRLRKTLDAAGNESADSIIETVRNEGYRLRLPIALIPGENLNFTYRREADLRPE